MERLLKQRGQIAVTQLVGWGIAIAVPTILASVGFTTGQITKLEDKQTEIVQRISVVETESDEYRDNIREINRKLDELLKRTK